MRGTPLSLLVREGERNDYVAQTLALAGLPWHVSGRVGGAVMAGLVIPESTEEQLLIGAIALCRARLSVADLADVPFLRVVLAHLQEKANGLQPTRLHD